MLVRRRLPRPAKIVQLDIFSYATGIHQGYTNGTHVAFRNGRLSWGVCIRTAVGGDSHVFHPFGPLARCRRWQWLAVKDIKNNFALRSKEAR